MYFMKFFFAALLFYSLAVFPQTRGTQTSLIRWQLKGKVKQCTTYLYKDEMAFKEKHPTSKNIVLFDENGQEIEYTRIDDHKTERTIFRYAANRIVDTTYSGGKAIRNNLEILDSNNRVVELDMEVNASDLPLKYGNFKDKTIFKYDNKGNQVEAVTYDEQGKLSIKRSMIYNNKNQVVEDDNESYRLNGIQTMKTLQSFNNSGLKVKESGYESGKLTYEGFISYDNFDKEGNWLFSTTDSKYHLDVVYNDNASKSITIREIIYFP